LHTERATFRVAVGLACCKLRWTLRDIDKLSTVEHWHDVKQTMHYNHYLDLRKVRHYPDPVILRDFVRHFQVVHFQSPQVTP